jgi:outer membrane protein with beta-barrel domain
MKYSKIILVAVILMLSMSPIMAKKANSSYDGPKPEVIAGAQALVFQYIPFQTALMGAPAGVGTIEFGGDLISAPITGMGYKYFISEHLSLGAGFFFGTESSSADAGKDADDNDLTRDMTASQFGLSIDVNYQLTPLYSVAPYIGGNLNFGSISTSDETTPGITNKTDYSSFTFGAGAHIGFDWYFTEGLSLGGRYGLGFVSYGTPELKVSQGEETNKTEYASKTYFGVTSASIILCVHI